MVSGRTFEQLGVESFQSTLPVIGVFAVAAALLSLLFTPFAIIYAAVNYLDLRIRKENLAEAISGAEAKSIQPVATEPQPLPDIFGDRLTPAQRIGSLVRLLRSEPDNGALQQQLGEAYAGVGDFGGAAAAFTRSAELNPSDTDVLLKLARVHRQRRDLTSARATVAAYLSREHDADKLAELRADPMLRELLP
jgi:cytochrome c-type biogenesis protein CcmH/NrfG